MATVQNLWLFGGRWFSCSGADQKICPEVCVPYHLISPTWVVVTINIPKSIYRINLVGVHQILQGERGLNHGIECVDLAHVYDEQIRRCKRNTCLAGLRSWVGTVHDMTHHEHATCQYHLGSVICWSILQGRKIPYVIFCDLCILMWHHPKKQKYGMI